MKNLPMARTENIVVQSVGKELLIYDLVMNKAYNLNETSRIVFDACDGKTTFDWLKQKTNFTDDIIYFALDELRRENLITEDYQSKFAEVSRRDVIKKIGLASMIAIPVIASVIAPKATQAQSLLPLLAVCTNTSQCMEGACGKALGGSTGLNCCILPQDSGCTSPAECCQDARLGSGMTCDNGTCCFDIVAPCFFDRQCCTGKCSLFFGNSGLCSPP